MIGLLFKFLGIIAFWEIIIQLIFKVSLFSKKRRELYVYIIGALIFTLILLFVKQRLDVPQMIFNYASLFYIVGIVSSDVVTGMYIKSTKKRIAVNVVFLLVSASMIFLLLPIIYPFI